MTNLLQCQHILEMGGRMDRRTDGRMDEWMIRRMSGGREEEIDGQIDWWMEVQTRFDSLPQNKTEVTYSSTEQSILYRTEVKTLYWLPCVCRDWIHLCGLSRGARNAKQARITKLSCPQFYSTLQHLDPESDALPSTPRGTYYIMFKSPDYTYVLYIRH